MDRFFNIDSPVMSFLSRMADIVLLNLIFIVCCLPIFTIGAASSALYYQTMRMSKNEEGYVISGFFKAFKENFVKATLAWLFFLALGALLIINLRITATFGNPTIIFVFRLLYFFVLLLLAISITYAFPLFSKFENTVKNTITNSLLMGIRHLPYTVVLMFVYFSPILAVLFLTPYLQLELLLMTLIWFSGAAYINGLLFHKIFAHYIPAAAEETETDETFPE